MAISQKNLKDALEAAFKAELSEEKDTAASLSRIAAEFSKAVATEIKNGIDTATVTHTIALVAPATGGAVTGTITTKLTAAIE